MSDLISRQAAIDALDEQIRQCDKALSSFDISIKDEFAVKVERASLVAFRETLEYLPSAEPKRGRWIKLDMHRGMADHKCTACKQECYVPTCMGEPMYAFCPNCGAMMKGENNESN